MLHSSLKVSLTRQKMNVKVLKMWARVREWGSLSRDVLYLLLVLKDQTVCFIKLISNCSWKFKKN